MRDVELLELGHVLEGTEVPDPVRLDAEQAKAWQPVQAVQLGDLVLGHPELLERLQAVEVLQLADPVRAQLEAAQLVEPLETLDPADLVGDEKEVGEFCQVVDVLDVLDLVEAQVEAGQVDERVESADVRDQVVVEVQVLERVCYAFEPFNVLDQVLAQADACYSLEAFKAQGRDGLDARVCADNFVGIFRLAVEEI